MSITPTPAPSTLDSDNRIRTVRWGAIPLILVWAAILPRIIPNPIYDRGIFVSVAERLLAGDRLYRDVWDNKDPLFFYSIALGRSVSPYADIILELGWIVGASTATLIIARRYGCGNQAAWLLALAATPAIVTGYFYVPGYTHLPGIALTLGILAAGVSRKFMLAGALLALLFFTKIVMIPIAGLLLLGVVIARRKPLAALSSAAGFGILSAAFLSVLAVRGETQPYVQSLIMNVAYSQSDLIDTRWGPFVGHLLRVTSGRVVLVTVAIIALIAIATWRGRKATEVSSEHASLWALVGLSMVGAFLVLGFTGVWDHHVQVLYVPAVIACVGISRWFQSASPGRVGSMTATLAVAALILSGIPSPAQYLASLTSASDALSRLGEESAVAQELRRISDGGTYARVGRNDEGGHADGLKSWDLACPRFHQYPFDSPQSLADVATCIPTAEVLLVSRTATPIDGEEAWNAFIEDVEETLRAGYSCVPDVQGRICSRL